MKSEIEGKNRAKKARISYRASFLYNNVFLCAIQNQMTRLSDGSCAVNDGLKTIKSLHMTAHYDPGLNKRPGKDHSDILTTCNVDTSIFFLDNLYLLNNAITDQCETVSLAFEAND